MRYSVYFDRTFIRVGDGYVPLILSGVSNGGTFVEKAWDVLNWKRRDRVLFSEAEIREIAKDYEELYGGNGVAVNSRHKPFAAGEFEEWVVNGMTHAFTIEEYVSSGNKLYVVDYPDGMEKRWRKQEFSNAEEFLGIIELLGHGRELHVSFGDSHKINRPSVRSFAYVCSPLRGDLDANMARAREYSRQVFEAGYCPITPHIYFPQFLNDDVPQEREAGMVMGERLLAGCRVLVVCGDTISEGMAREIQAAERLRIPILTLDALLPEQVMKGRPPTTKPSVMAQIVAARAESAASPKGGKSKSHREER